MGARAARPLWGEFLAWVVIRGGAEWRGGALHAPNVRGVAIECDRSWLGGSLPPGAARLRCAKFHITASKRATHGIAPTIFDAGEPPTVPDKP